MTAHGSQGGPLQFERLEADLPSGSIEMPLANFARSCHVVLPDRFCDHDRWAHIRSLPGAYARILDRRRRGRASGNWDSDGSEDHAAEISSGMTSL